VTIRSATRKELKRVAELINRTNQFNLCGSRTTFKEVTRWHDGTDYSVLVAEAEDSFGKMGIVSVAVTAETDEKIEILVFVLSCRVFGYGVEKAVLNFIRRSAGHYGEKIGKPIFGSYIETPYNAPCRDVYPDNGFIQDGSLWVYRSGSENIDPDWLTVTTQAQA
jgi:FkbH-like protein